MSDGRRDRRTRFGSDVLLASTGVVPGIRLWERPQRRDGRIRETRPAAADRRRLRIGRRATAKRGTSCSMWVRATGQTGGVDATIPGHQTMTTDKLAAGEYESAENILHLWFPRHVELADEEAIRAFFDEVMTDWIRPRSTKPYLLVNFRNLHIRANMASVYATNIARFQSMLLGTYR